MSKYLLFVVVLVVFAGLVDSAGGAGGEWKREEGKRSLGDLFGKMIGNNLQGSEANDCAACTVAIALLEQLSQVHNSSIDNVLKGICSIFPSYFQPPCDALVATYGPAIIKLIGERDTPDLVCQGIGFCANLTCHLFPQPKRRAVPFGIKMDIPSNVEMPSFEWPWELVADHLPAKDLDKDKFSTIAELRGTNWRGKDCNDLLSNIYPGRYVNNYGASVDHNCNGISGTDPKTKKSWEEVLCSGTDQYGYVVLGDSAG